MAYGLEFGGEYGKILLTLFRIVAIGVLSWYIIGLTKKNTTKGAIVSLSLILAGAAGNVIDCLFYGQLFGYQTFLHGKVVDMLYFPLFEGFLPSWIPFWGGQYFTFFSAIFNIADFAISLGVGLLLVFQKSFFPPSKEEAINTSSDAIEANTSEA
jgi:signal peptidase II